MLLSNANYVYKRSVKRQLYLIKKDMRAVIKTCGTGVCWFQPISSFYPEILNLLMKKGFDIIEYSSLEYPLTVISWENGKKSGGELYQLDTDPIVNTANLRALEKQQNDEEDFES